MSDTEEKTTTVEVEEAAAQKAAEEEAAKKAEEEAAAKKAAEEEAARKAAEEEAARKAAEEEAKELEEQMAELKRLQELNNAQWKVGQQTNFQNMTHTENGMKKTEAYHRARVVQGFMHNLTHTTQHNTYAPPAILSVGKKKSTNTLMGRGMMFGRFR